MYLGAKMISERRRVYNLRGALLISFKENRIHCAFGKSWSGLITENLVLLYVTNFQNTPSLFPLSSHDQIYIYIKGKQLALDNQKNEILFKNI